MLRHLPNVLTLLNLLCGCLAILSLIFFQIKEALIFQCISLIADFFDGYLARKLKVAGPLGVQLDSLADVISFGFFPGIVVYSLLANGLTIDQSTTSILNQWMLIPAFMLTLSAAYRLAKFNISTDQKDHFIGLPTPACTMFFTGLLLIQFSGNVPWIMKTKDIYYLYTSVIVFSYLMNSPFIHFKLAPNKKTFSNPFIIVLMSIVIGFVLFLPYFSLSISILAYVLLSIISNFIKI